MAAAEPPPANARAARHVCPATVTHRAITPVPPSSAAPSHLDSHTLEGGAYTGARDAPSPSHTRHAPRSVAPPPTSGAEERLNAASARLAQAGLRVSDDLLLPRDRSLNFDLSELLAWDSPRV